MNRYMSCLCFLAAVPRKAYNRILNAIASIAEGQDIRVDWTDARIINPGQINFLGSFWCGRGLWLEANGPKASISIGDGARLSDWVHIGAVGQVNIGRHALIGSKVIITDHSHGHGLTRDPAELLVPPAQRPLVSRGDVTIGANVWLGDNVVVLSGVTIGDGCVVGANSVVRSDLPAGSVCVGNPAKALRRVENPCALAPTA